jgi:alanine racemase
MASADVPATTTVNEQYARFEKVLSELRAYGINPHCIHVANSATTIRFPLFRGSTHIRPGIVLYGCRPDPLQSFAIDLRQVVSLTGKILSLRKVPANTPVSYGGHYVTEQETYLATVGLGYAHGVPRYLSNCGHLLIGGKRYRIAGNVTMDYTIVDAGDSPEMHIGDEALLFGQQGEQTITVDDIAQIGNTIGYEVLCNLSASVERRYLFNGNTIGNVREYVF